MGVWGQVLQYDISYNYYDKAIDRGWAKALQNVKALPNKKRAYEINRRPLLLLGDPVSVRGGGSYYLVGSATALLELGVAFFPQSDRFRGDLHQFVIIDISDAVFQAHVDRWGQDHVLIST